MCGFAVLCVLWFAVVPDFDFSDRFLELLLVGDFVLVFAGFRMLLLSVIRILALVMRAIVVGVVRRLGVGLRVALLGWLGLDADLVCGWFCACFMVR